MFSSPCLLLLLAHSVPAHSSSKCLHTWTHNTLSSFTFMHRNTDANMTYVLLPLTNTTKNLYQIPLCYCLHILLHLCLPDLWPFCPIALIDKHKIPSPSGVCVYPCAQTNQWRMLEKVNHIDSASSKSYFHWWNNRNEDKTSVWMTVFPEGITWQLWSANGVLLSSVFALVPRTDNMDY